MPKPRQAPAPRFDREAWLEAALEVLARQGQAKLRVETLARQLGVTKGSFYHHFKNREAFLKALLAYWAEASPGTSLPKRAPCRERRNSACCM
jgi:AcrR family transcriptional regulator